jgi:hypothetical protein
VIVAVALRGIGPQRFLFALLQFVVAGISDQLLCRLGGQRWRWWQRHGSSKHEDDETANVSQ